MEMDRDDIAGARATSAISFILGFWLAISPYVLHYSSAAAKWNQTLFGVVVLTLSAVRYLGPRFEWPNWFNGVCGLWLIVAPFILSYDRSVAYWNEVITGIAVAVFAFWSMDTYSHHHYHHPIS